jgi:tetraacyldisaccharide 4'-kinase
VCIGNPTAGGDGKTPAAIALAERLKVHGERPVFLTRGHGGRLAGPHRVDAEHDTAAEVGDEALLLARTAPTVVSADRAAGARFAESLAASVIVMDDGFQNPHLAKDLSILVVDRAAGLGNGRLVPAGPLRASVASQLARAQALVIVGSSGPGDAVAARARKQELPVFEAVVEPAGETDWLADRAVVAFAGIARPEKFFRTLEETGARLAETFTFPDHHSFSEKDAAPLLAAAQGTRATLVTTEKDHARLPRTDASRAALRREARPLPVTLALRDEKGVDALLKRALEARRAAAS